MLKISNNIITRVITVKYSIASPPNFIRGLTPSYKEGTTAFRLFGNPSGENSPQNIIQYCKKFVNYRFTHIIF